MKRRIGIVVLLLSLFLLLSFSAYADSSEGIGPTSGTCRSNLTWALSDDGTLTISGTGAMTKFSPALLQTAPIWKCCTLKALRSALPRISSLAAAA